MCLNKWAKNSSKHFQLASVSFYLEKLANESEELPELPTTWLSHCEPFRRFSYDKNLERRYTCFVKDKNFDHAEAKAFCEEKSMKLFDAKASQVIFDRLVHAVGFVFTSPEIDQAFVDGRSDDNLCNVIHRNGTLVQVSCDEKLDFFCEYILTR
jgi:hypothetical protein